MVVGGTFVANLLWWYFARKAVMVVGGTFVANLLWWYFARKAVMVVGGTFVLFPFCGNKGKTESSILMY